MEKECPSLSSFLYCLLKTMKLFSKCVICYFLYQKIILNYWFEWFLLIKNIFYNKKSLLFQLVAFKIYAIIQTVCCLNWLRWTPTRNSESEVSFDSWVHWKNQCRSTMTRHALLRNKYDYQDSVDIFVKSIFNPFHGISLKFIRKPEVSSCFQMA